MEVVLVVAMERNVIEMLMGVAVVVAVVAVVAVAVS